MAGSIDANGNPLGSGKLTGANGETFQGTLKDGRFSGNGRLTSAPEPNVQSSFFDGEWDKGEFVSGKMRGYLESGRFYEGRASRGAGPLGMVEPDGIGDLTWGAPGDQEYRRGPFIHGVFLGPGTFAGKVEGGYYHGAWADGKANGHGVFTSKDSSIEGTFVDGLMQGLGEERSYVDFSKFRGIFKNSYPAGKGTLETTEGDFVAQREGDTFVRYEQILSSPTITDLPKGDLPLGVVRNVADPDAPKRVPGIDGKPAWRMKYSDGTHPEIISMTYVGQINNAGMPQGEGVASFTKGGSFSGTWNDGKPIQGDADWGNGFSFSGKFQNGVMNDGTFKLPDGTTYAGKFLNGSASGEGELHSPDGSSYRGQFAQGHPQGSGTYKGKDGKELNGKFDRGNYVDHPDHPGHSGHGEAAGEGNSRNGTQTAGDMRGQVTSNKGEKAESTREIRGMEIEGHRLN